jgi:uncharacterized protein YuzB (UPF0349 family)
MLKVKVKFVFLLVYEFDFIDKTYYLCLTYCDVCAGGSVGEMYVVVFGDYVLARHC